MFTGAVTETKLNAQTKTLFRPNMKSRSRSVMVDDSEQSASWGMRFISLEVLVFEKHT